MFDELGLKLVVVCPYGFEGFVVEFALYYHQDMFGFIVAAFGVYGKDGVP